MPCYSSLFDELEKIAKGGPGSRGGKVVGYRKSGDPIYASDKKKPELVAAKPPPVSARVMGGGMGVGAMYSQVPIVRRYLQGRSTLYHGTDLPAAASIIQSPKGIDPDYAGKGTRGILDLAEDEGKKGRINRYLMGESLVRRLESKGVGIPDANKIEIAEDFHKLVDSGVKSGDAAKQVTKSHLDKLVASGSLKADDAKGLISSLQDDLSRHGHRVYFGVHPSDVAVWGSGKGEGGIAAEKMQRMAERGQLRNQARAFAEVFTGGAPSMVEDQVKRLKYKPSVTETMTGAQAAEELARLAREKTKMRTVFGASIPTSQMGYLEDFPGLKHLMGANPGMRHSLSQFLETYEPGRDISFPHAVPRENLQSVDLIDEAGKVRRINISDAKKAARGRLLPRLRRAAIPAAIAGLGGYTTYRAFKPAKKLVPKDSPLADTSQVKTAGSPGKDWRGVAKYMVPALAGSAALGIGSGALMDKIIPEKKAKTLGDKAGEEAKKQARLMAASLVTSFGSMGAGAGIGAHLARRRGLPGVVGALTGAMGGGVAGLFGGTGGLAGREIAKTPELNPRMALLPEKAKDYIRENPWIGGVEGAALTGALPVGGLYAFRKYYPVSYAKSLGKLKGMRFG